jgi:hypothetical protein
MVAPCNAPCKALKMVQRLCVHVNWKSCDVNALVPVVSLFFTRVSRQMHPTIKLCNDEPLHYVLSSVLEKWSVLNHEMVPPFLLGFDASSS